MKVLHVTHGYFPESSGGVETYLRATATAQSAAGIEVEILTGSLALWDAPGLEEAWIDGLRVHRLHRDDWFFDHYANSYHAGAERLIRDLLAGLRPDLVHVHHWIRLTSNVVAIARELGIRTVVTLHDVYVSCPRAFRVDRDGAGCSRELSAASCGTCVPRFGHESAREIALGIGLFRDQYRAELEAADRVLVAMRVTADLLAATTGLARARFSVMEFGYAPRFAAAPVSPPAGPAVGPAAGLAAATAARPFRFGYWGSLAPHKGIDTLLAAFRRLCAAEQPPVELHLFGPMPESARAGQWRRTAADLPVVFHGAFDPDAIATVLGAAGLDAGVFPALCFETFGLGLAECFELGLPAIVSDVGALAERGGAGALRVPPGDAGALAAAMARLVREPALRLSLARGIPAPPAPMPAHAAQLAALYAAVLAAPPGPLPAARSLPRAEFLALQRESLAAALRAAVGRRDPD